MDARMLLTLVGIALLFPYSVQSEEPAKRPDWDQKKAEEIVKKVVELEAEGQPWDKIAWTTDVDEAVSRSQKETKPIFVYFFLKKNIGPAAAPC